MIGTRRIWVAVFALALCACSAESSAVSPDLPLEAAFSGRPVAKVTGSGHFHLANGDLRTFSFNARERADGSVSGQFQINNRAFPAHAHGRVTCMTVIGNDAWLGGIIESSSNPTLVGLVSRWQVEDNGQGQAASPDRINQIPLSFTPGADLAYCADTPDELTPFNDVESGNIRIH